MKIVDDTTPLTAVFVDDLAERVKHFAKSVAPCFQGRLNFVYSNGQPMLTSKGIKHGGQMCYGIKTICDKNIVSLLISDIRIEELEKPPTNPFNAGYTIYNNISDHMEGHGFPKPGFIAMSWEKSRGNRLKDYEIPSKFFEITRGLETPHTQGRLKEVIEELTKEWTSWVNSKNLPSIKVYPKSTNMSPDGRFYVDGVKAVWADGKKSSPLQGRRIKQIVFQFLLESAGRSFAHKRTGAVSEVDVVIFEELLDWVHEHSLENWAKQHINFDSSSETAVHLALKELVEVNQIPGVRGGIGTGNWGFFGEHEYVLD